MTYFGAAGWRISDGDVVVLIDPWPSRLKYGGGGHPDDDRPDFARTDFAWSDTTLIDELIPEADFILIHHSHFDHLGDVPYIARKTGAKVIGTETAMMILRAYGIPDEQLYAVGGGEDYQFDDFSVRVVPGIHSALNEKHYHDTRRYDRDTELKAPLRIEQFIEGGSLSFLARFGGRTVLTMGSMNFIEREFEGLDPDILLAGINGSRLGLYDYDRRLLEVTGRPPIVIPTHWTTSGSRTASRSRPTSSGISSVHRRRGGAFPGHDGNHARPPRDVHRPMKSAVFAVSAGVSGGAVGVPAGVRRPAMMWSVVAFARWRSPPWRLEP